jgi:hypothetical protein
MVQCAGLFSQLLQHFPRTEFSRLVAKHEAERGAKGFTCWGQFVAMLFCQIAGADSLRVICNGLSCCLGKLSHLGLSQAPKRSTLSYANAHRPAALFEDLFYAALERFRRHGGLGPSKKPFRFKNKLLSLDASVVTLCLELFPWASYQRAKGGVKLHVLLDHDDYMPSYVLLSEARRHDRALAGHFRLNRGSIVVMDRGYNDYGLFGQWTAQGVYFVTRLKSNAQYKVIERRKVPSNRNIGADEIIVLTGAQAEKKCPYPLRRIEVWDPVNEQWLVLLTNHLQFGATTIAAIYKDRWQIELFFKALKQNLKIKTFVGTTENALRIQIWTALIALILLKWMHHLSQARWSLSNLTAMLRLNLNTYRPLLDWLHHPFGQLNGPPDENTGVQLEFPLPGLGQLIT